MSQYHIDRIASVLDASFDGLIDMSDWAKRSAEETHTAFLQRALSALCIKTLANVDDTVAAASVVDGYGDGGLFDQTDDIFYFVQSKWNASGTTPMSESD